MTASLPTSSTTHSDEGLLYLGQLCPKPAQHGICQRILVVEEKRPTRYMHISRHGMDTTPSRPVAPAALFRAVPSQRARAAPPCLDWFEVPHHPQFAAAGPRPAPPKRASHLSHNSTNPKNVELLASIAKASETTRQPPTTNRQPPTTPHSDSYLPTSKATATAQRKPHRGSWRPPSVPPRPCHPGPATNHPLRTRMHSSGRRRRRQALAALDGPRLALNESPRVDPQCRQHSWRPPPSPRRSRCRPCRRPLLSPRPPQSSPPSMLMPSRP